ncbi:MAG: hypothetical protein H0W28_11365 [Pyrinomonadaceae bacterium]|nr:hypothetical protein [Pyrinomonadaceae bacterium]
MLSKQTLKAIKSKLCCATIALLTNCWVEFAAQQAGVYTIKAVNRGAVYND